MPSLVRDEEEKALSPAAMLRAIIGCGRASGITDFHLSAQITAVDFYKKMGFQTTGPKFQEAGIEHINMRQKQR